MPLMALAAEQAGAAGIRTNGVFDVKGIKEKVSLPVIGLIKKVYEGFPQHITVTMKEIDELMEAGADIIALDCTLRERVEQLLIRKSKINPFAEIRCQPNDTRQHAQQDICPAYRAYLPIVRTKQSRQGNQPQNRNCSRNNKQPNN